MNNPDQNTQSDNTKTEALLTAVEAQAAYEVAQDVALSVLDALPEADRKWCQQSGTTMLKHSLGVVFGTSDPVAALNDAFNGGVELAYRYPAVGRTLLAVQDARKALESAEAREAAAPVTAPAEASPFHNGTVH